MNNTIEIDEMDHETFLAVMGQQARDMREGNPPSTILMPQAFMDAGLALLRSRGVEVPPDQIKRIRVLVHESLPTSPMADTDNPKGTMNKMIGKTIAMIDGCTKGSDKVTFAFTDGSKCVLYHEGECCESVLVEEVHGEVEYMIDEVVTRAEEATGTPPLCHHESEKWTFYRIACMGEYLTIRWFGHSNGYYGVEVSVKWVEPDDQATKVQ